MRRKVQERLGVLVRHSVPQTLNGPLDAQADQLCNARRYGRSPDRQDTRAGHCPRASHARAGPVELQVPKHGLHPVSANLACQETR